ncbi:hypothetical protein NIES267_00800 [Calothrix parasitica NIES-267]|uniref:RAP domain-containing protein n=1 Tax=Calothrix parasitica NIES-267 TaxID=1973488 RepID=A0A1Z4LHB4_9CYAN|nr:hypothetical protein NIES267_00800 [Calothrix parasitica NIES-267]
MVSAGMQQPASDYQQKLIQKIVKWKAGLADLGRRNPLIKFKQDSPRSLQILTDEPDILFKNLTEGKKSLQFQILDSEYQDINLLKENQKLPARRNSLELITRQTGNEQLKRLKKIRGEARRSFEERGVNSLFLVLGTLTWYDKDKPEDALLSPLILVPVELTKKRGRDIYKISVLDEEIVLNPALTQKLKQNFAIDFPEAETIQELNYSEIIALVREALLEHKTWEIKENVFLSLFSYAKAAMVRDIIENEALVFAHPILQAISGDLNQYQSNYQEPIPAYALDSQVKPERTYQILDADSSQQVVIEAAKSGSSFVVQGPPGTGKSQTIVNMITELIGDGKSVLLVAEKETALSVVYKRMAESGLDHICLNLHHSGTTDKRELVNNLSKTIDYLSQVSEAENHQLLFERLVNTRQSLNSYLISLHSKQEPLDKSAFDIFGELLKKEYQGVPNINVIFSNFNQWNTDRLDEAKDLLNQLAKFIPFFTREKTTIWAKSSINYYFYELELEIQDKIQEFLQAIDSLKILSQQLEEKLQIQPLSNVETLDTYYPTVLHIVKAPSQLPENWTKVDVATARQAFESLKQDVQEIERKQPSELGLNLLKELSSYLSFLREEVTTIWRKSKLQSCSETLELELHQKIENFQRAIFQLQADSERLQLILENQPLLNLEDVEESIIALKHILQAPSDLPEHFTEVDISNAENAFANLKKSVNYLSENETLLKQKYHSELFSSELPALNNNFQRYNRFWIIRILNAKYREDMQRLQKIHIREGKISFHELKRDLSQAVQVQAARNELYQNNYPARKIFGSLFNPEASKESELIKIEQALIWLTRLKNYSLADDSIQRIINSSALQQELSNLVERLESFIEIFKQGIEFLTLYFNENDIVKQNYPKNQISFTELISFLNQTKTDLPNFSKWLKFQEIYRELENLGLQEFIDALRDNKPNPIVILRNKLNQPDYLPHQVFGSLFNPQICQEAELKPIEDALNWLLELQLYSLNKDNLQQIIASPSLRRETNQLVQVFEEIRSNINQGVDYLLSYFNESDITDYYLPVNKISFVELENFINLAQSELADFQEWLTYKETYEKLESLGTNKFLDALRVHNIEPKLWFPILEKRIYKTCLDAILAKKPELKNFNVEVQEQQIQEFSRLDSSQLDAAKERLKQRHLQRWEEQEKTSIIQAELPKLRKEVTKKSRHLPIRKLLNNNQKGITNLVKALKPCWMMSPLSVSQYVNPNVVHFDVLIFDEASQLRTEDVVPSIIRSDQVIIIGDRKQLPPTSFFSTGDSEEDLEDTDDESYESVLDECSNFMFGRTLKWHYRSQDERLIAFSNKHFYDSQLVTFPNPVQNPDLGVWFKHVSDGIYDRGGRRDNRREAEVVAQLTLEHFQKFPEQSLGIIAFSEAQADTIGEQIEVLSKEYPELEAFCSDNSPQFFIKALENVQGDERDAIIISVGYARDSQGKFSLNFGPLIKQGGERRLNVAVTRAKRKLTLVSSIVAGDIDTTRTKSEGIRLLRDYLEYAASGGERLEGNFYTDKLKFDSPFEEDVYHTLAEKGYMIRTQVGCSGYRIDLGVVNQNRPGEFLLGIECDGASYHSSPTARDRDRLRQQVLERLGWKIHRVWSTDWFRNKPAQAQILIDKIEKLQQKFT